jgi:outer membrane receptor protein involved in Fe transport
LSAGGAYTHAVLTQNFCGTNQQTGKLIQSCSSSAAVAAAGTPLPYTPEFKGYATGRYNFPLFDWNAFGQVSVTYQSLNHVGLRATDNAELGVMPDYGTVDISLGASHNGLSLEFSIRNLTDTRGQENRFTTCPVQLCSRTIPGVPQSVYVAPIVPRTFALRLEQKF